MDNSNSRRDPVVPTTNASLPAESTTPSKNGLYILIVSLLILVIGLGVTVAYLLFFKEADNDDTNGDNSRTLTRMCMYNSITYEEGESFPATDGCNTCICAGGNVSCTEAACNGSAKEVTKTEVDTKVIEFSTYWLPDNSVVKTFEVIVPEDVVVTEESDGAWSTVSFEYGTQRVTFYAGDAAVSPLHFAEYEEIETENLGNVFRVVDDNGRVSYIDELVVDGTCESDIPEVGTVQSPCGNSVFSQVGYIVRVTSTDGMYDFSDAFVTSLRVIKE